MNALEETIVALSTPPGRGAIGLIRLSGPEALSLARRVFSISSNTPIEPARAILGKIRALDGEDIDIGYLTYHSSRRSYTGQEVVELTCHGNPVILRRVIAELMEAGARAAAPGEFTYRAMIAGKIDLAQAEGIRDLILAPTNRAADLARAQVRGDLSRRVDGLRDELVEVICRSEASLEFSEEPDVLDRGGDLARRVKRLGDRVERFVASYRRGRMISEGARVVLAGRPNSGKSSLYNSLLRSERSIVSDEPGTTRDFISERIDLDGMPVTLIDTAGLREAVEGVEQQGVTRARQRLEEADLILLLCGSDERPDGSDDRLMSSHSGRVVMVASKSDLAEPAWSAHAIRVSALTGAGIDSLREAIAERLNGGKTGEDEWIVTNARHHEALRRCATALARASTGIDQGSHEEIILVDLYAALKSLGEITGKTSIETIYDRIFSTFCIGK